MAQSLAPQQASQWQISDAVKADGFGESGSLESSDDDDVEHLLPYPNAHEQPPSDDISRQLDENNKTYRQMQNRLDQRKRKLQNVLKVYQRKEMEFVAQMDSHMDEVEHTEHALSLKIEALTAENHQLRQFNEKRERDNAQLAEKLSETTKQCSESETRVQFLLDRIVALLSSGSADASQTDAVVNMRQREREMLRQLEETRQQFDEVRQQNGELHSRLTEELGLSRRLQEQLVEVEERFSTFHHRGTENSSGLPDTPGVLGNGLGPSSGGLSEGLPLRACRLGPRPMGLRSDQSEAPPERERQPLPELPPPISEVGETLDSACPSSLDGLSSTLGPVLEGDPRAELRCLPLPALRKRAMAAGATTLEVEAAIERDMPEALVNLICSKQGELPQDVDEVSVGQAQEKPQYSRTSSAEVVLLMEQKLREALDRASFECAVVRVENGIYNFGPNVCAIVDLSPETEVIACLQGEGEWMAIDEFIRNIAQRPAAVIAPAALSSSGPGGSKCSSMDSIGEPQTEHRVVGPPLKTIPTYTGSSQIRSTAAVIPNGLGAVSSTSPRQVVGQANTLQPTGAFSSRQAAGSTPERMRMQAQQPPPSFPGAVQVLPSGTSHAQVGQQGGGLSSQRMLITPNSGPVRYGVAVSPGRQVPTPYPQAGSSPRC